jgi:hypothetical protein
MVLRAILYCLLSALVMLIAAAGAGYPAWQYGAGILFAAAFLPFLLYGSLRGVRRFFAVWWALLAITVVCLWSEAVIYIHATRDERIKDLIGAFVLYSLLAVAIAGVSAGLKLYPSEEHGVEGVPQRELVLRVLGSGAAYAIYYYVFGAIAFFLFTKPYYSGTSGALAGAQEAARSLGWWLPLIQIGRGVLMTLGVLPIMLSLRMKRSSAAIYVGLLLWVIGGLAPLIPPNGLMPGALRFMHTIEIFTQNFPLGVTAVLLLYPRYRQETLPALAEAAAR